MTKSKWRWQKKENNFSSSSNCHSIFFEASFDDTNIIYLPQDEWKKREFIMCEINCHWHWRRSLMLFRLWWKQDEKKKLPKRERWHLSAKSRIRFSLKANQWVNGDVERAATRQIDCQSRNGTRANTIKINSR